MLTCPLTHFYDWWHCPPAMRPHAMAEWAANDAENLVLGHSLMHDLLQRPALADELRAQTAAAGLRFLDAHAPFGAWEDLSLPHADRRPAMLARLEAALHFAAWFGAERCVIHVGNPVWPEIPLAVYHENAVRSLERLLPVAEDVGITICVENIWHPTTTPEALLALLAACPSDRLGVCFDSGHANLMKRGPELPDRAAASVAPKGWTAYGGIVWDGDVLEKLLPHVVTCHLHDNDGASDQHLPPGQGTIDWSREMKLLARAPRLESLQNETSFGRCDGTIAGACAIFTQLAAMPSAGGV